MFSAFEISFWGTRANYTPGKTLRIFFSSNLIGFGQVKTQSYPRRFHVEHFMRNNYKSFKEENVLINCFCGMVDRRKTFSLISSWDHCQRLSPSQISDMLRAGFEPAQNLSSDFIWWSCAVVLTTIPLPHNYSKYNIDMTPFMTKRNIKRCKVQIFLKLLGDFSRF